MWKKFQNTDFAMVLEPSAGTGDLAKACPRFTEFMTPNRPRIDCCEINVQHHPVLHEKGYRVVGTDFLEMQDGAAYGHCILNPPFAYGAEHVLHAWDIMWEGEISACINAETIRNPCSAKRLRLVELIEQHGSVEFVSNAFKGPDVTVTAQVEVALVYLRKEADMDTLLGDLLTGLKTDAQSPEAEEWNKPLEISLSKGAIENSVTVFKAAVKTMKDAAFAEARALYYASLLGCTLAARNTGKEDKAKTQSVDYVQKRIAKEFDDLKDRAWASILRSANVTEHLSSKAQRRVESEFNSIKQLEFSEANIYGFLQGILDSQSQIQMDMAADVFDEIMRYHTDNACYYRGWKSNDQHRSCGRRIKHTRFILPRNESSSWSRSLSWETTNRLADIDKVFAMLDGKRQPEVSLVHAFNHCIDELRSGQRVSTSYFDVRYYPGVGTIHFFPKSQEVVDRLNRLVGRMRNWLPPSEEEANGDFWKQYRNAEKMTQDLEKELRQTGERSYGRNLFYDLLSHDEEVRNRAEASIDKAAVRVHERHGLDIARGISQEIKPLLLAA